MVGGSGGTGGGGEVEGPSGIKLLAVQILVVAEVVQSGGDSQPGWGRKGCVIIRYKFQ